MAKYGFTLIELIITLAIISILGSISYPLYSNHLIRSRRLYVKTLLMDGASRLEQHYLTDNTYNNANLNIDNTTNKNHYEIKIRTKDNEYLLEAIPIGKQKQDSCGTLSVDQDGNKSADDIGNCWQ